MIACDQEVKRVGFSIDNLTGLTLGQQGEHLVKTIRIDMSTWLEANADLQVYAVALRHGETTPYLAATTMDEQELVWPVSSIDTGIQGVGLVQIIGSNGTSIAKSKMIRTTVGTILPGSDEADAPTLYQDTIDQLLADMGAIQSATESARDDAQIAQEAAENAQTAAENAQTAAENAQTAAQNAQTAAANSASQALTYRNTASSHAMNAQRHRQAAEDAAEAAEGAAEAAAASATAAAQSYESAAQSASLATQKANNAAQSAAAAEVATGHYPRIVGGYWQVWDAEHSQWNFTGVKATGDRGPQGEQGIQGPQGPQGEMGFTGPRGLQGPQGDKGDKGDIGLTGPRGDKGEQGDKGDKGDTGPVGPQGPKGDKGDTGDTGPRGPQGIQGEPGVGVPAGGTTGQVLAKASDTDRDTEWIDVAPIIHNTASGSVASFSDGLPLPADQVTVGIEPVQDLHGYDHPWPVGGGENKFIPSYSAFTVENLYAGQLIGTGNGETVSFALFDKGNNADISGVYFGLSGNGTDATAGVRWSVNNGSIVSSDITQVTTLRPYVTIYPKSEETLNKILARFDVMVGLSTTAYTSFSPYANICPITGHTGANVTRTGKNLLAGEPLANNVKANLPSATIDTSLKTVSYSYQVSNIANTPIIDGVPFKENTRYTFILTILNPSIARTNLSIIYTDGSYSNIGMLKTNEKEIVVATSAANKTVKCLGLARQGGVTNIYYDESGVFEGILTADDFEPYQGTTLPISWETEAGTVYGGELDVTTGVLTATKAYGTISYAQGISSRENVGHFWYITTQTLQMPGPKGTNEGFICDRIDKNNNTTESNPDNSITLYYNGIIRWKEPSNAVVSEYNAYLAENPIHFVYDIARPITYQLTPQQLTTLLGHNNVWADTGDVSITYKADTKRYIDAKFAELSALIANL